MALLKANGHVIRPVRLENGRVILYEARSILKFEPPRKRFKPTVGDRAERLLAQIRLTKLILGK